MTTRIEHNGTGRLAHACMCALAACMVVLTAVWSSPVSSQDFPRKPIRYIIPYATSGATDILGRIVAHGLSERVGQQVIVDNRPGASAVIGTEILARSPADGYTMMTVNIAHGANPYLKSKLPYDTANDFAPVTLMAVLPQLLIVNPSLPARSVAELVALAKSKPGRLNYSSSGPGSSNHLAMELFKVSTGIDIAHVPYKGGGPTMQAVLAGDVELTFMALPAAAAQLKAGKLIALATTSAARSKGMPDLPTIAESGTPDFEFYDWQAVLVPKGTPRPIIERLHDEIVAVLALPDVKEKISAMGAEVVGSTPEELASFIGKQLALWRRVVREAGIRPE